MLSIELAGDIPVPFKYCTVDFAVARDNACR